METNVIEFSVMKQIELNNTISVANRPFFLAKFENGNQFIKEKDNLVSLLITKIIVSDEMVIIEYLETSDYCALAFVKQLKELEDITLKVDEYDSAGNIKAKHVVRMKPLCHFFNDSQLLFDASKPEEKIDSALRLTSFYSIVK